MSTQERIIKACGIPRTLRDLVTIVGGVPLSTIETNVRRLRKTGEIVVHDCNANPNGGRQYRYSVPRRFAAMPTLTVWRGPLPASWRM